MATVQRRSPLALLPGKAAQFLVLREEEKQVKARKDGLNKYISGVIDQYGDLDEVNGHRAFSLPEPITVAGKEYRTLQRQKRVSMTFDEGIAEDILKRRGLFERATKTEVVLDHDEVYALHQMGEISDEEIDSMLVEKVTYALVPLTE